MVPKGSLLLPGLARPGGGLPVLSLHLKVHALEAHQDRDTPDKPLFRHPWRSWGGVPVRYTVNGLPVIGSRGKTVWYLPILQPAVARSLGLRVGMALKIVKVPVHADHRQEILRLAREARLQSELARHGLAPKVGGVLLLRNALPNTVRWFSHLLHFPAGSVHLATVVEHLSADRMPAAVDSRSPDFRLEGPPVARLEQHCQALGIGPRDLCLGNAFSVRGVLRVVDVHKWTWTADAPPSDSPPPVNRNMPWIKRAVLRPARPRPPCSNAGPMISR